MNLKSNDKDLNLSNIGLAHLEMENYNEALNYLNQALTQNPKNINAKVNMALTYKEMGSLEKALQILADVQSQNPKEIAALNNMANIYQIQGKNEQAAVMYLQALEID